MKIAIDIADDDIRAVLQTFQNSSAAWAADLDWTNDGELSAWLWEHDDTRNRERWKNHSLDFKRGLQLTLLNPPNSLAQFEIHNGQIECDAPGADYFIQFAVFGEQRYG
jgi:hypothetical protein